MKNNDIAKVENLKHPIDTFIIRWNVTKLCNYNCDFCIQGNKEKHIIDSKGESLELRTKICDRIIKFIEEELNNKYKNVNIYLLGGEVTILKDFLDILKKLCNCKFKGTLKIHITTNFSMSENAILKMKKVFNSIENKKYKRILSISCDYYKPFTTEKEFIKKIKLLSNKNVFDVLINLFKKSNIKLGIFIFNKLKKQSSIIVSIGYPIVDDNDCKDFFKFKRKYFMICDSISSIIIRDYKTNISEKNKQKLIKQNKNVIKVTLKNNEVHYFHNTSKISLAIDDMDHFNPKGFLCDAGMYNISISNLGVVSRCQTCPLKTKICDILDDNIKLLDKKFKCPTTTCNCTLYRVIENIK